ncbi:GNAT family N-acetyltransferase, partial [Vibrio cholerae]|nr:GNAT family N-acetyltransferase [Vibrio cholerae]
MEIIKVSLKELELLVPLFDAYRVFYGQSSNREIAHEFLKSRIQNEESVSFLAIDKMGIAVGFTQLYPSFSSVSVARVWILNDLYVVPESRGQGVSKQLMNAAREFALNEKAKGLALETAESNTVAQKLYESLGYEKDLGSYHYFLR